MNNSIPTDQTQESMMTFRPGVMAAFALLLAACNEPVVETPPAVTEPGTTDAAAATNTETERLNAWFEQKNEERLQFSPIELTILGRKELYDQIDQMSMQADQEQLDWHAATVEELRADFDYDALDFEARTSYDLWIYLYEQARDDHAFASHEYIFEQMGGVHDSLPVMLMNYHQVENLGDMEAWISRIEGIGRALRQQLEWARYNAERGVRPPVLPMNW